MKNIFKNLFYLVVIVFFLNSCQSVKEGLAGKKKTNADEFLVEKKNPLTVPPEFKELPIPQEETVSIQNEEEIDLKKIIINNSNDGIIKTTTIDVSTEKSIIEKIKNN